MPQCHVCSFEFLLSNQVAKMLIHQMTKNALFFVFATYISFSAQACTFSYAASDATIETVERSGGWPVTRSQCQFQRQHDLKLHVGSDRQVLVGTAIGWGIVRLISKNGVISDLSYQSTHANSHDPSSPMALDLEYSAIKEGLQNLDLNKAAKEIAGKKMLIKKNRQLFGQP